MNKFKIGIVSDLDYEGMVIDIIYEDDRIATLSCDEGIEKTRIKIFHPRKEEVLWDLDFHSFLSFLQKGFEELKFSNQIE